MTEFVRGVYQRSKHAISDLRMCVDVKSKIGRGERVSKDDMDCYGEAIKRLDKLSGAQTVEIVTAIATGGTPFPRR